MDIASLDYRSASEAGESMVLLAPDGSPFPGIDGQPIEFVLYGPQSIAGLQVLSRIRSRAGASDYGKMSESQVEAELEKDANILLPIVKKWPANIESNGKALDMSIAENRSYVMSLLPVWTQIMQEFRRVENFTPEPWRTQRHGSIGGHGPKGQPSSTVKKPRKRAGST